MKTKSIPITPGEARSILENWMSAPPKVKEKIGLAYPKIKAEVDMNLDVKVAIESKLQFLVWEDPELKKADKKRDETWKASRETNVEFWNIKRAVEKKLRGDPELYERLKAEALKEIHGKQNE